MNKNKLKRALALCCMMTFTMMPCSSMPVLAADTAAESTAVLIVWDGTSDTTWYDSQATELHIQTAEQLAGLATLVNGGKSMEGQTICLDNDILLNDTSDYEDWETTPPVNEWGLIGNDESNAFSGVFDGGGYAIEGLYQGCLFGYTSNAIITSLSIDNSYGAFCYSLKDGEISYCNLKGGLPGKGTTIYDGTATYSCIAPICYYANNSTIEYCNNYGKIIVSDGKAYIGGICGLAVGGKITNCSNWGDITFTEETAYVGGILGYNGGTGTEIVNCFNRGDIACSVTSTSCYLGGILGRDINAYQAEIKNVYNTGGLSGGTSSSSGGICGSCYHSADFINCYYLTSDSLNGIGNRADTDQIIAKNEANMKTEEFAAALGSAFLYSPGDYPILAQNNASFDVTSLTMDEYLQQKTLTLSTNYEGEPIWVSGDTSVATVENGVVTALKNGTTTIYAICGDAKAECTVTVDYSYYLNETELALSKGDTAKLAVYSEATKLPAENLDIVWTSSVPDVVTVDETGAVTAVAAGSAKITAAFLEFELVCSVTVTESAAVSLSPTEAAMQVGETLALTVSDFEGSITWVSTDTQVATVDANGVITAAAEGESVIYAILSTGTTLSCNVTVTASAGTVLGDVNLDGTVGVLDVVALQRYLLADLALDDAQFVQADMNADGAVNVFDLALLKKAVLAK